MVLSDKKFIEFSEQVWERNKELLAEKRELLDEVRYFKELAFDRADEIEKLRNENGALRKDIEEVNARCNEVMDKQYEHIRELERKRVDRECKYEDLDDRERELKIFINPENGHVAVEDCDEFEDISDDWDDLFEDDLAPSDRFINCTFNLNFK